MKNIFLIFILVLVHISAWGGDIRPNESRLSVQVIDERYKFVLVQSGAEYVLGNKAGYTREDLNKINEFARRRGQSVKNHSLAIQTAGLVLGAVLSKPTAGLSLSIGYAASNWADGYASRNDFYEYIAQHPGYLKGSNFQMSVETYSKTLSAIQRLLYEYEGWRAQQVIDSLATSDSNFTGMP